MKHHHEKNKDFTLYDLLVSYLGNYVITILDIRRRVWELVKKNLDVLKRMILNG